MAGFGQLLRLYLRQDRIGLAVWPVATFGLVLATAAAFEALLAEPGSRESFGLGVTSNPGFRAMLGPVFDATSVGGLTAWRVATFGAALVAVMNIVYLVRHTRGEEETGRAELIGAGSIGRHTGTVAAAVVVLGADLVLALLIGIGVSVYGLPVAGSFAFGFGLAACGAVFAGFAAVAAQVFSTARAAIGAASLLIGVAYLLRAVGDSTEATFLSWLSPLGWVQRMRPFADERWWVLLLPLGMALIAFAVAAFLRLRRDVGSGMVAERRGPAEASDRLSGVVGLAIRLQRGVLLSWVIAVAILGGFIAGIGDTITDLFRDNPNLAEMMEAFGGGEELAVDMFLATALSLIGINVAIYGLSSVLRSGSEEQAGLVEPLLAASVSRRRWFGGHLVMSFVGTVLILTVVGLTMGFVNLQRTGEADQVPRLLVAALSQAPAIWVLAGVAAIAVGWFPRQAAVAWAVFGGCVTLFIIGDVFTLPAAVVDLSPYSHLPDTLARSFGAGDLVPLVALTAVAALFTMAGLVGIRRRDLRGN